MTFEEWWDKWRSAHMNADAFTAARAAWAAGFGRGEQEAEADAELRSQSFEV